MDSPSDVPPAPGIAGQSGPVLVGYDVTAPDRGPVEFGIATARSTGASRITVCVYASPAPRDRLGSRQLDEDLVAQAARGLEEVRTENMTMEYRALASANVARGLHEAAKSVRASLLVVGSARPRAPRALPGSLVERIMHGVSCPIAVIPYGWDEGIGWNVIGAAYIDSREGREALKGAHALARRAGARLRVVTAVRAAVGAADAVQRVIATLERNVPVETTTVEGNPADVLVYASRNLDVLVIGSRGYGRLGVVSLGDVNRRVALEAHCPVIVMPRGAESLPQVVASDASGAATAE
jgi:nucleotide-binding universal stress UspA family protein